MTLKLQFEFDEVEVRFRKESFYIQYISPGVASSGKQQYFNNIFIWKPALC